MRADKFFAEKYGSRSKAKEALCRGEILRGGKPLSPSDEIATEEGIAFLEGDGFVSGGGKKLERGLSFFGVSVEGRTVADLGASTGGFTDCLLRHGARHVYCVDVGESQLDPRIAGDERVTVMDRTNARYLTPEMFSEPINDVVSDLSFISLRLVLPAVQGLLPEGGRAFLLFKPQFECGGKGLGKRGILPVKYHRALLSSFYRFCAECALAPHGIVNAPIVEGKNVEYMVYLEKGGKAAAEESFLSSAEKFV